LHFVCMYLSSNTSINLLWSIPFIDYGLSLSLAHTHRGLHVSAIKYLHSFSLRHSLSHHGRIYMHKHFLSLSFSLSLSYTHTIHTHTHCVVCLPSSFSTSVFWSITFVIVVSLTLSSLSFVNSPTIEFGVYVCLSLSIPLLHILHIVHLYHRASPPILSGLLWINPSLRVSTHMHSLSFCCALSLSLSFPLSLSLSLSLPSLNTHTSHIVRINRTVFPTISSGASHRYCYLRVLCLLARTNTHSLYIFLFSFSLSRLRLIML